MSAEGWLISAILREINQLRDSGTFPRLRQSKSPAGNPSNTAHWCAVLFG